MQHQNTTTHATTMKTAEFQDKLINLQSNLLSFAYTLTNNRDDAYDLLQDTTIKALTSSEKYADDTNFKGWVFTIMRNIFINNYRRTARMATVIDTTDDCYHLNLSEEAKGDTPEGTFNANEISRMIESFDEKYRHPFKMHIAGYKYTEIAEQMELPVGTVKSRIFTARQRLQEIFADPAI